MTRAKGKALVTGGAGFIGSYIVEALLERGYEVRIFDSLEPQVHGGLRARAHGGQLPEYLAHLANDVEFVVGDVRDRGAVTKALEGVDYLFHKAAAVGVPQSMYEIRRYTEINSLGGATVLDAVVNTPAVRDRLKKMVVASSMSIYGEGAYRCAEHGTVYPKLRPKEQLQRGDWQMRCPVEGCGRVVEATPTAEDKPLQPLSIYAIGKRDHEEMFLAVGQAYGIPAVALRYWQVYGQRQALSNPYTGVAAIFCSRILAGNPPPVYEDGLQLRDFVHASDIARANVLALEHPEADYQAINVGTGNPVSILDVAWTLVRQMEADKAGIAPAVLGQFRPGDTRDCVPDLAKARRRLGYEPRVTFQQGAAELIEWVLNQEGKVEDRFEQAQRELRERGL
ncbi:MAG: NAD-dependent epimerase/dehydratase family protein [Chloroflexi bacterium]|nr:NAD-dependent epimerase/dehydratase family protein [Chloroflexota bacterium]